VAKQHDFAKPTHVRKESETRTEKSFVTGNRKRFRSKESRSSEYGSAGYPASRCGLADIGDQHRVRAQSPTCSASPLSPFEHRGVCQIILQHAAIVALAPRSRTTLSLGDFDQQVRHRQVVNSLEHNVGIVAPLRSAFAANHRDLSAPMI
jgi:hypothetical protein